MGGLNRKFCNLLYLVVCRNLVCFSVLIFFVVMVMFSDVVIVIMVCEIIIELWWCGMFEMNE